MSRLLAANRNERIADVVKAWNDYPDGIRATLMLEWPDLYWSVSHLVRYVEVAGSW